MRLIFPGELADLRVIMYVGLAVKLVGAALRYWVGFDAYQGGIDAQRYHDYAVIAATDVWADAPKSCPSSPVGPAHSSPKGVTALIYTVTGTSKMAGFVVFSFLGFIGTAFFVKAACIAIPGLARRTVRHSLRPRAEPRLLAVVDRKGCVCSSSCSDSLPTESLGLLSRAPLSSCRSSSRRFGLVGAVYIRPHIVGIWLAGAFPALLVAFVRGRDPWGITVRTTT